MTLIDIAGMPLIDQWHYAAPTEELAQHQHAVIHLPQWEQYQEQFAIPAPGVWINGDQDLATLTPLLPQLHLIVIEFPKSRDGRGFTLARNLRERHQYIGDIRAAGPVLPDQFGMLIQCGYTSLLANETVPLVRWREAAKQLAQTMAHPKTLFDRLSQSR